jgi:hypothetical protein
MNRPGGLERELGIDPKVGPVSFWPIIKRN